MKLLLSAYCCAPESGSEQSFGWWWATRCAERHDVTVLTPLASKPRIETYLEAHPLPIRFEYVPGPRRVSSSGTELRFERLRSYLWQLRAAGRVRELLAREHFDLAQQVTIGSWRQPSAFASTADRLPYILGPMSGSERIPGDFLRRLGPKGAAWETVRAGLIVAARHDPQVRRSLERAALILAVGPGTLAEMNARHPAKTLPATRAFRKSAISARWAPLPGEVNAYRPLEVTWMGRLIPRKGLELLIHAVADPRLEHVRLNVIGDGPQRRRWGRLATRLGVRDRVLFLGGLPQPRALNIVRQGDLFAFTSLQDMMGQSLSEAMQLGVPCLVLDWSGPAWLAGDDGAYKIPVTRFGETQRRLADALLEIRDDGALRQKLGDLARARIELLTDPKRQDREIDRIFERAQRSSA